ncbi:hypothetical protein DA2_2844 [Desulfovibrio sp. A2]|nr:hypothetical protein DA2_2844 [Desulfovibrio sp. A2]
MATGSACRSPEFECAFQIKKNKVCHSECQNGKFMSTIQRADCCFIL